MTNRATRAASARTTGRPRPRRVVRRSSPRKRFKTFLALTFLFCETIIALVAVTLLVIFWRFSTDLPSTAIIAEDVRSPVATTIWSQDGVLLGRLEVQNRSEEHTSELQSRRD